MDKDQFSRAVDISYFFTYLPSLWFEATGGYPASVRENRGSCRHLNFPKVLEVANFDVFVHPDPEQ